MRIAVDAMGGDHAPSVVVDGAIEACGLSIPVMLVGDKSGVEAELARHPSARGFLSSGLLTLRHASQVIDMCESPIEAVRRKKDASISVCFDAVKSGEASAVVSAGNSGAAMAAGIFTLRKLKGVDRPAIAVSVPTMKEPAVLLDVGGNVDCRPAHLVQFAIMGHVYSRYALGVASPRVGLLSNGEEEDKGNDLTRETNALLKKAGLNYIGYVEGRDIYRGGVDVVVSDGFVGNVALKLSEGLVEAVVDMLKREIMASLPAKLGYLMARGAFKRLRKRIDYAEYGGAPLLGIDGICMISHGSSSARAIKNAVIRASEFVKNHVNDHIAEELSTGREVDRVQSA